MSSDGGNNTVDNSHNWSGGNGDGRLLSLAGGWVRSSGGDNRRRRSSRRGLQSSQRTVGGVASDNTLDGLGDNGWTPGLGSQRAFVVRTRGDSDQGGGELGRSSGGGGVEAWGSNGGGSKGSGGNSVLHFSEWIE